MQSAGRGARSRPAQRCAGGSPSHRQANGGGGPRRPRSPLFFCVRAISFSISDIFSRIPMAALCSERQTRRRFQNPGPRRPRSVCPEAYDYNVLRRRRSAIPSPGGRCGAECPTRLVPPSGLGARWDGWDPARRAETGMRHWTRAKVGRGRAWETEGIFGDEL